MVQLIKVQLREIHYKPYVQQENIFQIHVVQGEDFKSLISDHRLGQW